MATKVEMYRAADGSLHETEAGADERDIFEVRRSLKEKMLKSLHASGHLNSFETSLAVDHLIGTGWTHPDIVTPPAPVREFKVGDRVDYKTCSGVRPGTILRLLGLDAARLKWDDHPSWGDGREESVSLDRIKHI